MQRVLSYRAAKWPGREEPRCSLEWAGHETQEFINLFPEWITNAEVARINKEVSPRERRLFCDKMSLTIIILAASGQR